MNFLTDVLPKSVEVSGRRYAISSDFRTSIIFECAMMDKTLTPQEKAQVAENLYYTAKRPDNLSDSLSALIWFYRCGKVEPESKGCAGKTKQIYSFEHDDQYIYAAFMEQFGIDLSSADLHWWQFRALFNALSPDTLFVKIMGWRAADISGKMPASEKKRLKELQERYALPKLTAGYEKLSEIESVLLGDGNIDAILQKEKPAVAG